MDELRDRVAVITGGASGIGYGIAAACAAAGMRVVLADIEPAALETATATLAETGVELLAVPTDVSDDEQVERLADVAYGRFGAVHLLVNNAGIGVAGPPMWELTLEDWRWSIDVNLWGVIHGIRHFVPRMLASVEPGHIVSTASAAGLLSPPGMGAYNVTKHGVVTLSETLYHDLRAADAPIGVSVLCPGMVRTRIMDASRNRPESLLNDESFEEQRWQRHAAFVDGMTAAAEQGMDPEELGAQVLDAVREDRFYILPHAWVRRGVQYRMNDIVRLHNPRNPNDP